MKSNYYCIVTLLCSSLLFLSACGLISNKCGPRMDLVEEGSFIAAWTDLGVNAGKRIYQISRKVDHVCPDEHVTALFSISTDVGNSLEIPITVEGRIEYSLLFDFETVIIADNATEGNTFNGNVEVGLSQANGDTAAQYWVVLTLSFDSTGQDDLDLTYAEEHISFWHMASTFYEYSE